MRHIIILPNHLMSMILVLGLLASCKRNSYFKRICFFVLAIFFSLSSFAGELSYNDALESKKAGEYKKSEKIFLKLIKADPSQAELWFHLGLAQRFQGDYSEAMKSQEKALSLSPKRKEVRLEIARLHYWTNNHSSAQSLIVGILKDNPDYKGAVDFYSSFENIKNIPVLVKKFNWQFDLSYERSHFTRLVLSEWSDSFLQVGYWVKNNSLLSLRVEKFNRRSVKNSHYQLALHHIFNPSFNLFFSFGHTPDSTYIPETRIKSTSEIRIISDHRFLEDTWFTLNLQRDTYKSSKIYSLKPGLRYSLSKSITIHGQSINIIDESDERLVGWSGRLDWESPFENLRVFGGFSEAPETEDLSTVITRARFIGMVYQTSSQVSLRGSYAEEDRENSYMRYVSTVGLSMKF